MFVGLVFAWSEWQFWMPPKSFFFVFLFLMWGIFTITAPTQLGDQTQTTTVPPLGSAERRPLIFQRLQLRVSIFPLQSYLVFLP